MFKSSGLWILRFYEHTEPETILTPHLLYAWICFASGTGSMFLCQQNE